MSGSLIPSANQRFYDASGKPLVGGKITTYSAGTTSKKSTFQDRALSAANTNPVTLDARGEATMYGTGVYRLMVKAANGALIYDRDNVEVYGGVLDAIIVDIADVEAARAAAISDISTDVAATDAYRISGQALIDADVAAVDTRRAQAVNVDIPAILTGLAAFNERGAWSVGTVYALKDIYIASSIAYVVTLAHTSTTVAADLAVGKVAVHQGATREELAAPSGSALVGFMPSGAGAIARTISNKLHDIVGVKDFGAVGNGVVDDTAALQLALDSVGSRTSPPTTTWVNQLANASQGTVTLDPRKIYKITAALEVPPGVTFDLNGSTIKQVTAGQDAIRLSYVGLGYSFYGRFFDCVKNGFIQGPGNGVSTKRGIHKELCNFGHFENLSIQGFKFGVTEWECQYSTNIQVYADANVVGWYITAQPIQLGLTTIDNSYINCGGLRNTKYGAWLQCSSFGNFDRADFGRNGVADIVIGGQLVGYVPTYTVTGGGSGYPANAQIVCTITGGSGSMAAAFATTNAAGVVVAVYSIDAGDGYTSAPSVIVPGGGVLATVVAAVVDDTGLGDWNGPEAVIRGKNKFSGLKIEHGPDRPSSGYAIIINSQGSRRNVFDSLTVSRQAGGAIQYFRWMRTKGFGTIVDYPSDPSDSPDTVQGFNGDVSIFRSLNSQCLAIQWGTFVNADNGLNKYVIDQNGALVYEGKAAQSGFNNAGHLVTAGMRAAGPHHGNVLLHSYSGAEVNPRYQITYGGMSTWGPGGTGALDTVLYRDSAAVLKTNGKIFASQGLGVGNWLAATTLGAVVRKIQIFDDAGTAIGYLPVYNNIA